jgi:hypothetical protein
MKNIKKCVCADFFDNLSNKWTRIYHLHNQYFLSIHVQLNRNVSINISSSY